MQLYPAMMSTNYNVKEMVQIVRSEMKISLLIFYKFDNITNP